MTSFFGELIANTTFQSRGLEIAACDDYDRTGLWKEN